MRTRLLLAALVASTAVMAGAASEPAWWGVFVAAGLVSGGLGLWVWRRGDVSMPLVLGMAVLLRLLFVWLPPVLSDDAFRYVWDGMLQHEGIHPYRYVPADPALARYHAGPLYAELNSARFYSVYPPVSQLVFALGGAFYGEGWLTSFFVVKAVFLLFEVGAVWLLSRLVEARTLLLYAWHPLVLVEVAGQGHTEGAMLFFLAATLVLLRRSRPGWAAAALTAAGWVKLYPFVLLPFLWRRYGWKTIWPVAAVSLVVAGPYAIPEAPGHFAASLDLYVRYFEFNAGPYFAVKEVLRMVTGQDWSKVIGPILRALFLVSLPVLYFWDRRDGWAIEKAFLVTLGMFFVCSTTVHPWYLLGVLPLAGPSWHWLWLGAASLGTYLHYVEGPYWAWVWAGWGGWLVLALHGQGGAGPSWLQPLQRARARRKAARIDGWLPPDPPDRPLRVLDLGAGEGYVGAAVARNRGAEVVLADVVDFNRTLLPHVVYDGERLPFGPGSFDATVLYFVLHHCADPERVLREALRVTHGRVIVAESTFAGTWELRVLTLLDRWANRLRSGGRMRSQEAHLDFRTVEEWRACFHALGAEVVDERHAGRGWVHRQVFFLLAPPGRGQRTSSS